MKPPVYSNSWSPEVKALYAHDMQEIWDPTLAPNVWCQYHNQLKVYSGFARSGPLRILDVGCAQGTLALTLAENGHVVTAVDIRPEFLEYAKSRYTHGEVTFVRANALQDCVEGEYDVIFANQIIEHLVYPVDFFAKLGKLLSANGCLVVATPNWHYLRNPLPKYSDIGDPKQFELRQFTADADGHFFAYTAEELKKFSAAAGLRVDRCQFFETPFVSGHMKIRYLHRFIPHSWLQLLDRLALAIPVVREHLSHQLVVVASRI